MSSPMHLLLERADDNDHADRAWLRMFSWGLPSLPSMLSDQVDEALRLTRRGADPNQHSRFDGDPPVVKPRRGWWRL